VVSVLPGVGDGTFDPRMDFAASRNPSSVAIVDLDGDGRPDLVTSDVVANTVSILRSAGGPGGPQVTAVAEAERGSVRAPRISPNPLSPSGALVIHTARPGSVEVRVFDVRGRLVRTIAVPGMPAGIHEIPIDGRDARGRALVSGIYFYSLRTADGVVRGRFAVVR
jgi:hypothetical protein